VVLKCLSKKPESRYQSMDELAADLDRVRTGQVANAVTEMMARSGGFNVPADYFKSPNAIVPATPPAAPQKKWARWVWVAGAAAAVGIVGTIFVISGTTNGKMPPRTDASAVATAAPPASATAALATGSAVPAPPPAKKTAVAVAALPDSAQVWLNGAMIHQLPWSIEVEAGKPVTIEIKADGYTTETLTLDGSEGSKMVKLRYAKTGRPGATQPGGKVPAKKGKSDVVDPWGK
jgi:serine/threonine-protein kinase